jgi:GMP synthase-like glutamine amidotransferase
LLAKNDKGIQAMAIGSKIISLQGHPECGVEQVGRFFFFFRRLKWKMKGWDFLDREGLDADLVAFAQQSLREHGGGDSDLIATMVAEQIFSNFK